MNWNMWLAQIHRWLSIVFTVPSSSTSSPWERATPPIWIYFLALLPLVLLLFTGLYLFMLPYTAKWRSARRIGGHEYT